MSGRFALMTRSVGGSRVLAIPAAPAGNTAAAGGNDPTAKIDQVRHGRFQAGSGIVAGNAAVGDALAAAPIVIGGRLKLPAKPVGLVVARPRDPTLAPFPVAPRYQQAGLHQSMTNSRHRHFWVDGSRRLCTGPPSWSACLGTASAIINVLPDSRWASLLQAIWQRRRMSKNLTGCSQTARGHRRHGSHARPKRQNRCRCARALATCPPNRTRFAQLAAGSSARSGRRRRAFSRARPGACRSIAGLESRRQLGRPAARA